MPSLGNSGSTSIEMLMLYRYALCVVEYAIQVWHVAVDKRCIATRMGGTILAMPLQISLIIILYNELCLTAEKCID